MELPPPVMKHQVRNLSVQQDINVLRGGAASDAFGPRSAALQALKEFMDAEQRKARKRSTLLATVLGILLLALVGAGAWTALHVSKKAAAGAGVVQADVAEVRKEVQAIRRDAETRAETWAADLRAVQKSLAEAQDNLTGLREELATALQGAAGEPGAVSSLTALMQEVQVLRSEQLELDSRRAYLQNELDQLADGQNVRDARKSALAKERGDLAEAVKSFATRQQDAEARLQTLTETKAAAQDSRAAVGRSRKIEEPTGADAAAVLAVMEDLLRLRSEQLDLKARHAMLQKELDELESAQRFSVLRQQRAEQQRLELASRLEAYQARQKDLQGRLEGLKAVAPSP
jgi:chromosome segregation ATPase